jgi:transcriptional regulator with XRE-family HTH domain
MDGPRQRNSTYGTYKHIKWSDIFLNIRIIWNQGQAQILGGGRVEQFGERLRRLRGDRSQKSVAEQLDIPQTTLSTLEKQTTVPRGELLTKLAEFFDVPIDYFYEPQPRSSEPAKAWLLQLRAGAKGLDTVATHSREPVDRKTRQKIAEIIKKKNETANKNQ